MVKLLFGLLDSALSALGLGSSDDDRSNGDRSTDVRVERERDEPETGSEAAVKGTEASPEHDATEESAAADTDASGSTGSVTEAPPEDEETAAEPAEAAGPSADSPSVEEMKEESPVADADAESGSEPEPESDEPEAEESAAADTDASGSTGSVTEEPPEEDVAAEPSEAAGPSTGSADEAELEADDGDATDQGGEETAVDTVSGIGPAYADRLNEAGIDTVDDLVENDATELAEETGISEKRIKGWQDTAE